MRRPTLSRSWSLALAAALPLTALTEGLPPAIAECRAVADDRERLACYDRAASRAAASPPADQAPQEPPLSPEERFGRQGTLAREEHDRRESEARELGELHATVTEIWTRGDGLMRITLDNGQIWAQNRPDPFFRLREGDRVKITPASLGSFLMSGPSRRSTRVTRLE